VTLKNKLAGGDYSFLRVTVGAGASLSGAIELNGGEIVGFVVPTWDSAALSFQASNDNGTYRDVYDKDGTTETKTGASTGNRFIAAPDGIQRGYPWIKIRSGLTAAAVNQTNATTITIVMRSLA